MEGVLAAAAVRRRIGQRADRVDQLDHRAGPAVGHEQRQRILVRRRDVDEVDVYAVDLGDELRKRVHARLNPAEVVLGSPVAGEGLQDFELDSLRPVGDELLARPPCRGDAPAQIDDLLFEILDVERPNLGASSRRLGRDGHVLPPRSVGWTASPSQALREGVKKSISSSLTRSASS
jgi:hypothetical protein